MPKITKSDRDKNSTVVVKTNTTKMTPNRQFKWWEADSKKDRSSQLIETAAYLKEQQQYRYRQAGVLARLYGNMPLMNIAGSNLSKMNIGNNLPLDRPTMNVIQSCVDTLVSRVTQSRPRPIFLTDNADYKQRNLAKQMNNFTQGELYQTRAYEKAAIMLRDAGVLGNGILKVYEDANKRVALDRVLETELLVDPVDGLYGEPRQLYQFKLVDRGVLANAFPEYRSSIAKAEQAYPDNSAEATKTVSDQVMVVEGWRLPSSKDSGDGRHMISCSAGPILDEEWKKSKFPFVFLGYSPRILGFWSQGLAEQLMGTQVEINQLLMTISKSINLVGVPRVFVEDGSKVVKAHQNNQIGAIVTYRGTKPIYEVAPCMPQEVYAQLQRLVEYAYQQSGVSALSAAAQKPAGLNSGEAIRNYDDLQSDRFAALVRRYDNVFIDLAYQIIDLAKEIAERDGKYTTVYPNKNGTKEIDLPATKMLEDTYVIQCFDASSLPRDPAGRLQKVTEMAQSGMITMQEARRLLDYPDLEQVDKLANSSEERILQILDEIVETGKYTAPDPFMNLDLASQLVTQYYNLYAAANLEESKQQKLRDFFTQIQTLKQAAIPDQPPPMAAQPQAVPQAPPVSDILPTMPQ
jgi:hypothetical protein